MYSLIDKLIVLAILSIFTITNTEPERAVIILTSSAALSAFLEYTANRYTKIILFGIYIVISAFSCEFLILYPLICYDFINKKSWKLILLGLPAFYIRVEELSKENILVIAAVFLLEIYMKSKTDKIKKLNSDYIEVRDNLTEASIALSKRIQIITDNQNNEVKLAALNERTRIAREIHDNVGHLLSSAILQLGAIIITTKDEQIKSSVTVLKDTLTEGMNSIRNSVHNLRDDSVDLYVYLNGMIKEFTFCKAKLVYEASTELNVKMKLSIIAIVKEALSNTMKHSNATEVSVSFIEHPKIYQLIIYDNGNKLSKEFNSSVLSCGMGLDNIRQRAESFNGLINITHDKGFRIFISFRKETT